MHYSESPRVSVFLYHEDQTLSGSDYPPGDNLLSFTGTLNEDDPSTVLLTGMPQIRTQKKTRQIVEDQGLKLLEEDIG